MMNHKEIINSKIEKLDEVSLELISGGWDLYDTAGVTFVCACVGALGSLVCPIVSRIYNAKASSARDGGDEEKALSYDKTARVFTDIAIGTGALTATGLATSAVIFSKNLSDD